VISQKREGTTTLTAKSMLAYLF